MYTSISSVTGLQELPAMLMVKVTLTPGPYNACA